MSKNPTPREGPRAFQPVSTRARHDGWTPERQSRFIEALAECACVDEACRRVGMGTTSAYALRRRLDAQGFRIAWDAALDYGVRRLSDAAFSRAINGVARPVFFKGELIGERRYYDERLTQFLLRYRDPVRYGRWRDANEHRQHPDAAAILLSRAQNRMEADAVAAEAGLPPPTHGPHPFLRHVTEEQLGEEEEDRRERLLLAQQDAELAAELGPGRYDEGGEGEHGGT